MTNPTYPGVYMKEVSSGVRPITAAGTSVAAFLGVTERGPINEAKKIFNIIEYQTIYGDFIEGSYLAQAVYYFFKNGGTQCYVGRIADKAESLAAACVIPDRSNRSKSHIQLAASSPGAWGNNLRVRIDSSKAVDQERYNRFNLTLYRLFSDPLQPPAEVEHFADLSMDPTDPKYATSIINGRSLYMCFTNNTTSAINGYSESAPLPAAGPKPLLNDETSHFLMRVDGGKFRDIDLSAALADDSLDLGSLADIKKVLDLSIPESLSVEVSLVDAEVESEEVHQRIHIQSKTKTAGSKVEVMSAASADAASALRLGRRNGGKEVFGSADMRPADSMYDPATDEYTLYQFEKGANGPSPVDQDYVNGLSWLDTVDDVSLIAVPGAGSTAVIDAALAYCENRVLSDCFFIADVPQACSAFEDIADFREAINAANSYGALYYPWLKTSDPAGRSTEPVSAPPSGFVAGLYARTDAQRGVWKAPAGTEAKLYEAAGLETELTDQQHGDLNLGNNSVCVIRRFPGSGNVVWGTRTLSEAGHDYRYIPVRRMAIMLRKSIYNGIQWAVFEPNDAELWSQLRLNIRSFMMTLFRQGAFQGQTPAEAFFVKCDGETTPPEDVALGIVNVQVGFAPLRPAEFLIVTISQKLEQVA